MDSSSVLAKSPLLIDPVVSSSIAPTFIKHDALTVAFEWIPPYHDSDGECRCSASTRYPYRKPRNKQVKS